MFLFRGKNIHDGMKCRSGKEKIECKAGATEMEIRETRSKFSTFRLKSYFFRKDTIFLMRNGKISIFIERKLKKIWSKISMETLIRTHDSF